MLRDALSAVPLLAVAAAGLFGSLAACDRSPEDGTAEDALYEDYEGDGDAGPDRAEDLVCRADRSPPFTPTFKPSQRLHQGVCNAAQIAEIVRCRVTPLSVRQQQFTEPEVTACKLFDRGLTNRPCRSCALSFDSRDPVRAALLDIEGTAEPNLPGCIGNFEAAPAQGCSAKLQASEQCVASSKKLCDASCAGQNDSDNAKCQRAEARSTCAPFDAACARSLMANGPAAACDPTGDRYERARQYITLFCGE